ncbi:MAG: OmpA family protein [Proteobacteria bacterium]|nr:OmpA family protein [Pseudomonadota bacterium]MBU1711312.1 OmpA family protein [Pseudomonadota bacterium]
MKKEVIRLLVGAVLLVSLSFYLGGCAQQKVDAGTSSHSPAVTVQPVDTPSTAASTATSTESLMSEGDIAAGQEESLDASSSEMNQADTILEGRSSGPMLPVYFDFDRFNIREDQKVRIENNAAFIKESHKSIRIEGNCDERGTNEYNMALGMRRANSSKKYLVNLGVDENLLGTISYGEEKPLNYGHDELAWSQNRRDDFVIIK